MITTKSPGNLRFSAKLLFQFRVENGDGPGIMRLCEERIIIVRASTPENALALAKRSGDNAQHDYKNNEGHNVYFEFIGIMDLLHLGIECDADTVWYDIVQRKLPMERADSILPPEDKLNAIIKRVQHCVQARPTLTRGWFNRDVKDVIFFVLTRQDYNGIVPLWVGGHLLFDSDFYHLS